MTNQQVLDIMQTAVVAVVKLSGPILFLSMAIGVFISILQAATQIHEQTITFVPKLLIIAAICLMSGSWMLEILQEFTRYIFAFMI